MKKNGTTVSSPAEWVRYERKYSNAMWHWHAMKDERFRGLNLIDDASRCSRSGTILACNLREHHSTETGNETIRRPCMDNGACFVGQ